MNQSIRNIIYVSILIITTLKSTELFASENQLPGLLKFANEYEEKKIRDKENNNQSYNDELSGIQLPQLKIKMLNNRIQTLTINEKQYKIKFQQQESDLLVSKLNKISLELLTLLNRKQIQAKLKEEEALRLQMTRSLDESKKENLNLSNNIQLLSQRVADSEKAQKVAIEKQQTLMQPIAPEKLKNDEKLKNAYAAGIAIGQDAMLIHKENQSFGQDMDKKAYLAGITDAIQGNIKLSPTELHTALIASSTAVDKNRNTKKVEQAQLAKTFLANWHKQKNVKSDPLGYTYKINYEGQGKIQDNDLVSIVVKETLLDGTVVSDMDLQDKSLTLPIDNYPPLFQSAIRHLQNHGEITFIVPPELAYGDDGYPPIVPPGASLIYTLRVADIKPASAK